MKQIIRIILIAFSLVSCQPKAAQNCEMTAMESLPNKMEKAAESRTNVKYNEIYKKKIIKDGRLGITVKELKKAKAHVDTLVQKIDGYYENESFTNSDYETAYTLKIRIPSDKLESFIAMIESGESKINYKVIEARDVTEEYIDLEARLQNKHKYLTRYQIFLQSTKSIKEVLDIQEKIRGLEEEIESTTGKMKYINDLVNYSTLELNITQEKNYKFRPEQRENLFEKLKESLSVGWYSFVDFLFFLLSNWAILILFSVILYFGNKYRKIKKGKKRKNNDMANTPNA
jgi:flagellar biosynthesis chaperone FliJ